MKRLITNGEIMETHKKLAEKITRETAVCLGRTLVRSNRKRAEERRLLELLKLAYALKKSR